MMNHFCRKACKIAVVVIVLASVGFIAYKAVKALYFPRIKSIHVEKGSYNPANNLQTTSVKLFANGDNLYVWEADDNTIKKITGNGKTMPVTVLSMDVLAVHEDFVYGIEYAEIDDNHYIGELCSYNIITDELETIGKVEVLPTIQKPKSLCSTFTNDGIFYVPSVFPAKDTYIPLLNGTTKKTAETPQIIELGNRLYWIEGDCILCQDGEKVFPLSDTIPAGEKQLVQTEHGILVYNIWNKTNLLYLINENGEIDELFADSQRDCLSSVNLFGDYAYISIMRYDIGQELFIGWGKDPLTGTFRIRLVDGTIEKISDEFYYALYIFDNNGIYAIDGKQRIIKMDFNGNVVGVVLEE